MKKNHLHSGYKGGVCTSGTAACTRQHASVRRPARAETRPLLLAGTACPRTPAQPPPHNQLSCLFNARSRGGWLGGRAREKMGKKHEGRMGDCLLYTSPSPRDRG
eukprot:3806673-Rhodomonas_salina.1